MPYQAPVKLLFESLESKRRLLLLAASFTVDHNDSPDVSDGVDIDLIEAAETTNFPKPGDNSAVSLKSSQWERFPLDYAESLQTDWPEIWRLGGNIKGNQQFSILSKIAKRGGSPSTEAEENAIRLREAWVARHYKDHLIAGVIAQVKWLAVGQLGVDGMKKVIEQRKELVKSRRSRSSARSKK